MFEIPACMRALYSSRLPICEIRTRYRDSRMSVR
eukprot:SAG31_NODE_43744_length_265_cov_2.168675_1_plen_33_part_01